MPLGTLLFSCASTNFDQHLRATHKVAEHNSCVIKNHSALAPDSESAFFFGELGDQADGRWRRSCIGAAACTPGLHTWVLVSWLWCSYSVPQPELASGKGLAFFIGMVQAQDQMAESEV